MDRNPINHESGNAPQSSSGEERLSGAARLALVVGILLGLVTFMGFQLSPLGGKEHHERMASADLGALLLGSVVLAIVVAVAIGPLLIVEELGEHDRPNKLRVAVGSSLLMIGAGTAIIFALTWTTEVAFSNPCEGPGYPIPSQLDDGWHEVGDKRFYCREGEVIEEPKQRRGM
jgi:hypothetical protein